MNKKLHFQLLNIGHALDHYFILIFPTVVLFLTDVWAMSYDDLLKIGSVGVFAYGAGALPSGWLADKYGRHPMMVAFFIGIGVSSIMAGLTNTPTQLGIALAFIGLFAAIYHPVGIPLVYETPGKTGRLLAINGIAGNLGLAIAAMVTSYLAVTISWRAAFIFPGAISVICGIVYDIKFSRAKSGQHVTKKEPNLSMPGKGGMVLVFGCIVLIATCGGLVFNSITTALPKVLTEEPLLKDISLESIGTIATAIFVLASSTQLVIGELMERMKVQYLLAILAFTQIVTLLLAASSESSIFFLTVLLFATFGQIPVNDWLTGRFSTKKWRSRFFAARYTLGLGVSSVAYWLIALIYAEGNGFSLLFQTLGLVMVPAFSCALILIFAISKIDKKHEEKIALNES
ncbi:MFS transporter [Vibrio sp. HN007]|uniref:MFS transporter n=1 Tax=Vibrio iocasae TaxID=3098914 RepID=UPI0035D46792